MASIENLVSNSSYQNNPISMIKDFMDRQDNYKKTATIDKWRFVGYVLDISYEGAQIITNDTYKMAVGGIPRGSFLILVPANYSKVAPHFTLLRVKGISSTPLTQQVQQTYFEMHKRSMPELDLWTQADLQWGALDCDILGMFYADPNKVDRLAFSGDVNNIVSAHKYEVYAPDEALLNLIVNGTVRNEFQENIGNLRTMECQFGVDKQDSANIPVNISMRDFMGCRTAMFGKTRLGKSNVVKLIAQGMLDATADKKNVGQLIFDINGEYANDSDQDNVSLRSANPERCIVYALTKRPQTESRELKLNFYEKPDSCKHIIKTFLENDGKKSNYITAFNSVELCSFEDIGQIDEVRGKNHAIRKIQIYWSILHAAGFATNEATLRSVKEMHSSYIKPLDPHFNKEVMGLLYGDDEPEENNTLETMCEMYKKAAEYIKENGDLLVEKGNKSYFDVDEKALLGFLVPKTGSGPMMLAGYRMYHSPNAKDFVTDIIELLESGKTVILDLGNAQDSIRMYFSDLLSNSVFGYQEKKFVTNALGDSYIQLYFEEAHNLFPPSSTDNHDVYSRFAKEGAKFHIGMVYSTQSPSTISQELLVQTENFFVGHLSSTKETKALATQQILFDGVEDDILRAKTPGYMRMLTMSNRFVVPVQAKLYAPKRGE